MEIYTVEAKALAHSWAEENTPESLNRKALRIIADPPSEHLRHGRVAMSAARYVLAHPRTMRRMCIGGDLWRGGEE